MAEKIHSFARKLRQSATDAEKLLWQVLRDRRLNNLKFRRQHPIANYIVDFYCAEKKLIVEVDGDYFLYTVHEDQSRQEYLESLGFRVLRFWNKDVLTDLEAVVKHIQMVADGTWTPHDEPL
jgi:very-short-patch-repair endonuclease